MRLILCVLGDHATEPHPREGHFSQEGLLSERVRRSLIRGIRYGTGLTHAAERRSVLELMPGALSSKITAASLMEILRPACLEQRLGFIYHASSRQCQLTRDDGIYYCANGTIFMRR
jgi:hypothetical protein